MKMTVYRPLEIMSTVDDQGRIHAWQVQPDGTLKDVTNAYNRAEIKHSPRLDSRKRPA